MWRTAAYLTTFLLMQTVSFSAAGQDITRLKMPSGMAEMIVRRAIEGAVRRLDDPICQRILTDFSGRDGRTLLTNLQGLKRTPAQFLTELWFVDASTGPQCMTSEAAAFTTPGSRVVFVCGFRFADRSLALDGRRGEVTILHEMLHALGLGENPPTSGRITDQVITRCDRPARHTSN